MNRVNINPDSPFSQKGVSQVMGKKLKKIRRFFKLYTTGLNRREVERLLQKDAVGAISYFKTEHGSTALEGEPPLKPGVKSFLHAVKDIFLSFIMKLTPARRLCYGLALVFFLLGLIQADLFLLIVSFVGMNFLLALELVDKLTTRDELEIAREIQMSLQPRNVPDLRLISVASSYRPARLVGGDFFDIVMPSPDKVISIIGDVSGKGISAALYAAYAQSMFQSLSAVNDSPAEIFRKLNALISQRLRDGDFITALIAVFDLTERSATIARAGHNWPLHYRSADESVVELRPRGMSIGLFTGPDFDDRIEEQKIKLTQGDCLVFYSDGITEATDEKRRMFEIEGLKSVVAEYAHEDSEGLVNRINVRLLDFVDSDELQDDATLLAVKVGQSPGRRG